MNFKKLKNFRRRVATGFLIVLMCLSTIASPIASAMSEKNATTITERVVAFSDVTGTVDLSNVKLENLSEYVMANVDMTNYEERAIIVNLQEKSLVESANGRDVVEYVSSINGKSQQSKIKSEQNEFLRSLNEMGLSYEFIADYDTVINGIALKMNTAYVSLLKLLPNVQSVVISETYSAPQTVEESSSSASDITNETSVYQTGIYDSSKYADEYGGKGMVVAVLDTGLDYTHEAFQTQPDQSYTKYKQSDIISLMAEKNFAAEGNVFVSDKIPFAYDYADRDDDVYPSYSNHGTHVAGIIAGSADSYTDKDGLVPKEEDGETPIEFMSVAPNAQLVICKVFTDDLDSKNVGGATTQDILDALDDCVKLGVDVINMSLGTTCGFSSTNDGDYEGELMNKTYQSILDAGISLICAASNDYSSAYGGAFGTNLTSNPDSGTVGSPSTFTAALSVASISGKKSPYVLANDTNAVFYNESSDENNVDYDFAELMLDGKETAKFNYVVIKGTNYGSIADYNASYVKRAIKDAHDKGEKIIALVKRGGNLTFQEKVENAMKAGADAIIVYNNVAGEIKMTIGDVENPIPAISISYEAGQNMVKGAKSNIGYIEINPAEYSAGPFMSNFSSWGVTSDLKLKPEITAHGGEITSSVPGGWDEQSGTSMATPNVAGLVANIRSYISQEWTKFFDTQPTSQQITRLTNQLMMSTATIVVDQEALPYSPRKQGAGLASLENIIDKTNAYLYTTTAEDYRPKIELGEDEDKTGVYNLEFYINNVGNTPLSFKLNSIFMTETVSVDGLAVAEQAYMLNTNKKNSVWTIEGKSGTFKDGDVVEIQSNSKVKISVALKLTDAEKKYLDKNFKNGMYVEGFLQLISQDANQCSLSLPFLGFYGDWESAPMLDYDAFEISKIEQDTSILEDEKPKASVWATQAYSIYWNDKFVLPMGSFVYTQNEDNDEVRKIYTTEEYSAISCYNEYTGEDANNYMTSTGIKGIYAGLLRNAKQVDCRMYNVATGELMYSKVVYRVNKAYSGGGGTTPGYVKLELTAEELGLVENGQYRMEFDFHYKTPDENTVIDPENTFKFSFYVDYTAPVLEEARIRYFDYKEGNKDKQTIYLDLDVYDNHYSMAALLCYLDDSDPNDPALQLCTEYVTPIYDAKKNGITTVSIDITDILDKYGDNLYVELDDYALNHSVYQINVADASKAPLPDTFSIADGEQNITIGKYETHKVNLVWNKELYPVANESNFTWTVAGKSASIIAVKNGEIVGLSAGNGVVSVSNGYTTKEINVEVVENNKKLNNPSISFDVILNDVKAPVKAQGSVKVNVEQDIKLEVITDPWYYTLVSDLDLEWSSSKPEVASVDNNGNVKLYKKGSASIMATIKGTAYSATVVLNVQESFKVSNFSLTSYTGSGGVVYIPKDMNIMTIGEEAFKNNTSITAVIIPKTVTTIDARAFYGCTNLKHVFFVDVITNEIAESDLTLINREAFLGCTSLEVLDFSNCKTFTVARSAFSGCTSLKLIKGIEHIGTAYDNAFSGCTSLIGSVSSKSGVSLVDNSKTVWDEKTDRITNITTIDFNELKDGEGNDLQITGLDISGLHVAGSYVFSGCTSIKNITTAKFTAIGVGMFADCKGLKEVVISDVSSISSNAFIRCFGLKKITFKTANCAIGQGAFSDCGNLIEIIYADTLSGQKTSITSIGDNAFKNTAIKTFEIPNGLKSLGDGVFSGTYVRQITLTSTQLNDIELIGNPFKNITLIVDGGVLNNGVIYSADGTKVIRLNSSEDNKIITILDGVVEICDYAFADTSIQEVIIPSTVKIIGDGAFKNSDLNNITFASGSQLTKIGEQAFYGTSLSQITLPNTVKNVGSYAFADSTISQFNMSGQTACTFGDGVFANCAHLVNIDLSGANVNKMGSATFMNAISLANVKLSSVIELGSFTFMGATNVKKVVFGADSTTTGDYTFFTYALNGQVAEYAQLSEVVLGDLITEIGSNVFVNCTALKTIDLKGATKVNDLAFYGATSLEEVKGLDKITDVGAYAFYNTKSMTRLELDSVINIGIGAFRIDRDANETVKAVIINMPKVKTIGAYAFYGTGAQTINLPDTLCDIEQKDVYNIEGESYGKRNVNAIGVGAFTNSPNLKEIKVAKTNTTYFDEDGVLYRNIDQNSYELVSYPAMRVASDFIVKEGTVRIEAYAFAGAKVLANITLPYSMANIGAGAFFESTLVSFTFESHYAPTLESEFNEQLKQYIRSDISFRGMFYNNFVDYVMLYTEEVSSVANGNISTLSMTYPKNGNGYDNYLYRKYFTSTKQSGHVLTASSRIVRDNIDNMSLETVSGWLDNSFAVNEENKQTVISFATLLKETHRLYNNVSSDKNQIALIKQSNVDKMFSIEEIMRQVKEKFNVKTVSTGYSFGGNYKKDYVVGETFDLTGLVITIVYDDYSTQEFTGEDLALAQESNQALTILDSSVKVICGGKTYAVDVKVREASLTPENPTTPNKDNTTLYIVLGATGGAVVVAGAILLVLLKKKGLLKIKK